MWTDNEVILLLNITKNKKTEGETEGFTFCCLLSGFFFTLKGVFQKSVSLIYSQECGGPPQSNLSNESFQCFPYINLLVEAQYKVLTHHKSIFLFSALSVHPCHTRSALPVYVPVALYSSLIHFYTHLYNDCL